MRGMRGSVRLTRQKLWVAVFLLALAGCGAVEDTSKSRVRELRSRLAQDAQQALDALPDVQGIAVGRNGNLQYIGGKLGRDVRQIHQVLQIDIKNIGTPDGGTEDPIDDDEALGPCRTEVQMYSGYQVIGGE